MDLVTIELRPLIQSCYVFLLLKDEPQRKHMQIIIKRKTITFRVINNSYDIKIPSTIIELRPDTVSHLEIIEKWIIFRVQMNPSNSSFGTFNCELINDNKNKIKCSSTSEVDKPSTQLQLPPKNTRINLMCSCCKHIISNADSDILFVKVLPLPSDDCDPCDWFCCTHDNKIDYKSLLTPTERDFYYGSHFYVLNKNIFEPNLRINQTDVLCKRCFSVIGVSSHIINSKNDVDSFKIWHHSIEYSSITNNNKQSINIPDSATHSTVLIEKNTPLLDFKLALKYCLDNESDTYNGTNEICLFAKENSQYKCILLKVIEKNLNLLTFSSVNANALVRNTNVLLNGNEKVQNIGYKEVNLKNNKITKILFNFSANRTQLECEKNENLRMCQVSLKCIVAGMDYLVNCSKRIPPIYRFIGEYCVSYVL